MHAFGMQYSQSFTDPNMNFNGVSYHKRSIFD